MAAGAELEIRSHHQPLSHASGWGPTPSGRHTLAVGFRRCPPGHASGCGPTPSGRHTLPVGSHRCPASHGRADGASDGRHIFAFGSHQSPAAHCAELTAGVATVETAIGMNVEQGNRQHQAQQSQRHPTIVRPVGGRAKIE